MFSHFWITRHLFKADGRFVQQVVDQRMGQVLQMCPGLFIDWAKKAQCARQCLSAHSFGPGAQFYYDGLHRQLVPLTLPTSQLLGDDRFDARDFLSSAPQCFIQIGI